MPDSGVVTEEELQRKREENEKLRRQLREAEAQRVREEQAGAREEQAAALDAENERLQRLIAAATGGSDSGAAVAPVSPVPNAPSPALTDNEGE